MSADDRLRWDHRYRATAPPSVSDVDLPHTFRPYADLFPTAGTALDIACGSGTHSLWLARRGLRVRGLDISPVAIGQARDLARKLGLGDKCEFDVVDLDHGLPPGPRVDVLLCTKFRDRRLDAEFIARLRPGGLLAISALSEVGAAPGGFRIGAGELDESFSDLTPIGGDEADGLAWLLARR